MKYLVCLILTGLFSLVSGKEIPHVHDLHYKAMMEALEAGDHGAFLAPTTEQFQQALTDKKFSAVVNQVGPALAEGYQTEFLGELILNGYPTYLYKIDYLTSSNDGLVTLVLTLPENPEDAKVSAFWIK